MNKLIAAYCVVFVVCTILNGFLAGGGGIGATYLTAPLPTSETTTMNVASTDGFLGKDVLSIDNEQIYYQGKTANTFTTLTRGYNQSTATVHGSGKYVYTQEVSHINQILGYNIASTYTAAGVWTALMAGFNFLFRALINLVIWNFPNLFVGELVYLRIILMAIGSGLVVTIILRSLGVMKT